MVDREIDVPDELIEWDGRLHFHESDARRVEEAARETAAMLNQSRKPVLIAGIEIHRYKASRELVELAEKIGAPVLTTVLGKGAFPMDHPLYMGVHVGPISPPPIVARMDAADFVLNLGCLKTDMNFGNRPPHIIEGKSVWAVDRRVDVKYHTYINVGVRDFVRALLRQELRKHRENGRLCRATSPTAISRTPARHRSRSARYPRARSTIFWPRNHELHGRR